MLFAPGGLSPTWRGHGATEEAFAQRVASMRERTMVGRVGAPEDIAAAVAFLADPVAGFVTAQVLTVGGWIISAIAEIWLSRAAIGGSRQSARASPTW